MQKAKQNKITAGHEVAEDEEAMKAEEEEEKEDALAKVRSTVTEGAEEVTATPAGELPPPKQKAREPKGPAWNCLLYTSPSPRDGLLSRMPSSA